MDLHHRIEHLDIETPQKRNLLVYIEPIYMDSLIIDSEFAVNDFVKADSIFKNSAPDLEEGGTATVRYLDLP